MLASSVNPIDWKLASGAFRYLLPVRLPATPGMDMVGEVIAVGPHTSGFAVGQRVVARVGTRPGGACAEQALVGVEMAVLLPDGVAIDQAAALPLAGMTALQGLRDDGGLRLDGDDRRVLIVGASGGVGHYAVQLARLSGAHVTGVCSTAKMDLVQELGADVVIDYTQQSDFRGSAPYDLILDCAAKAPWARFEEVLAPDGVLSQPTLSPAWLPRMLVTRLFSRRRIKATMLQANSDDLGLLLQMLADGRLRSVVGARFPFTALEAAWAINQQGGTSGKIVLTYPAVVGRVASGSTSS
jgi:NADPH:quinone reductase-like Zn-dependent oxidoreductase